MYVLACSHVITLVVHVGKLGLCSKIKWDFFLNVPEKQMQISHRLINMRKHNLKKLLKNLTGSDHPLPGVLSQLHWIHLGLSEQLGNKCTFESIQSRAHHLRTRLQLQDNVSRTSATLVRFLSLFSVFVQPETETSFKKPHLNSNHVQGHICAFLLQFLTVSHSKLETDWVTAFNHGAYHQ